MSGYGDLPCFKRATDRVRGIKFVRSFVTMAKEENQRVQKLKNFYSTEGFPILKRCAERIPHFILNDREFLDYENSTGVKIELALMRLIYRKCALCGMQDYNKLFACPECEMTWYCSRWCQGRNKFEHDRKCLKKTLFTYTVLRAGQSLAALPMK